MTVFRVRHAIGNVAEGPALINPVPFSARYDLDWDAGRFSRIGHPLDGEPTAGRILICPAIQGGVAGGWAFLKLASRGAGLAGLVFGRVNPVMVQGAQAAGIPIAAGIDDAIFQRVENGALIQLDPRRLQVELLGSGPGVDLVR